jgi:hypothetical protein
MTKTFISLPSTDPYSIAKGFYQQMYNHDSSIQDSPIDHLPTKTKESSTHPDDIENDATSKALIEDKTSLP